MIGTAEPDARPGARRTWTAVVLLLLATHAVLLAWAAARALAVERADYAPVGFASVALGALAVGTVAAAWPGRHLRAVLLALAAVASAMLLTPGALAVVLLCLLSAHVLGLRLLRFLHATEALALPPSIPLLAGLCVWIGLVGASAGLKMHFAPVYALLLVAPLVFAWRDVRDSFARLRAFLAAPTSFTWTERAWLALALMVYVLHLFMVARPEVGYDAGTMHLQIARIMAEEHRFRFDVTRYLWALMPMGADWAYTVAYVLAGETAARAANLAFGIVTCALAYRLVARHAPRELALASVVLFASTPLAFAETSSLYVENLWTAFLIATLLVTLEFRARRIGSGAALPVLALLAAGAMQCKVIGVLWLAPLLAYAAAIAWRAAPPRMPGMRGAAVMTLAAVLGLWPYANAWLRTGNPVFPFMNALFRSPLADTSASFDNPLYSVPLVPWSPYEVVMQSHRFIEGADGAAGLHWLLLLPLVLVLLVRRRRAEHWLCAALGILFFVAVHTQQAYLRYLYPGFVLLTVLGGWALAELGDRRMTRAAILAVGGALCLLHVRLIPAGNWPNAQICIGCAFDRHERDDFMGRYMGDRVIADYLANNLPDARVGFLMLNAPSPAGFVGYSRSSNWHDYPFYTRVSTATSAADIEAAAREFGLTHIVYRTRSPDRENPAIVAFRETRTRPLWKFQDYVVAVIEPPL